MYNIISKLKSEKILWKYLLKDVNASAILLYRNSSEFIFPWLDIWNYIILNFVLENNNFSIKLEINDFKITISSTNENYTDLNDFLKEIIISYEETIFTDIIKLKESGLNNQDFSFYYFFSEYLDLDSLINSSKSWEFSKDNIEPKILKPKWSIIYNSDRNVIYKTSDETVNREMKWINSLFGISTKDFLYNSVFLVILWFINKKVLFNDWKLIVNMPLYHEHSIYLMPEITKKLISFNKETYIGKFNWLNVSLVQEDPNNDNFMNDKKRVMKNIDYDSVTVSYMILQPIFVFIDYTLVHSISEKEIISIFKEIIVNFNDAYYFEDYKSLWSEKIFDIFEKTYVYWIEKNNDWLELDEEELLKRKWFFDKNRDMILELFEKQINMK